MELSALIKRDVLCDAVFGGIVKIVIDGTEYEVSAVVSDITQEVDKTLGVVVEGSKKTARIHVDNISDMPLNFSAADVGLTGKKFKYVDRFGTAKELEITAVRPDYKTGYIVLMLDVFGQQASRPNFTRE